MSRTHNKQTCLTRQRSKPKEYCYYALDIEYTREDGVLIEGCIGDELQQFFFTKWDDMLEYMFHLSRNTKNVRFIVHAGNIAEYVHIIKFIRNSPEYRKTIEIDPVYSGESIISMDLIRDKEKITIIDMFAIFPMGLAKIAKVFAPEYPKLAESVDFSKRDYNPKTDREYLRRDVQATCNSYKNVCALIAEHFGVQPSLSAAGTAMRAWLYELPPTKKYFRQHETVEDFCREGYFGAYVHPGRDNEIHVNVVSYDVTAAYGARMRYRFPVGTAVYSEKYRRDRQGLWRCVVTCLEETLPMVPYRKSNGVCWLGRENDSCETTITREEIEYFLKHGYAIEILYGYYWPQSDFIFADFIDKVERVESLNPTTKQCAKIMRNALYGRFGTKKFHEKFIISSSPDENMIPYCNPETGDMVEDLYVVEEELDVPYIQPHWAAYITAYQRIAMFDLILQCGMENFLGCDTDSIKTYAHIVEEKHLPISETEYGKGKIEATFDLYRSHGPKNYVGIHDETFVAKTKGIPKKYLTQEHLKEHLYRDEDTNMVIEYKSITKALTMLKKDGRMQNTIPAHRTLSSLHSEKWELVDGTFKPVRNIV